MKAETATQTPAIPWLACGALLSWMGAVAATSAFQMSKQEILLPLAGPARMQVTEGLVHGAFFLAWALASWPMGRLGDRLGRRTGLAISTAVCLAGLIATAAAPSLPLLIAARILSGIGSGGIWGPAVACVAEAKGSRKWAPWLVQTGVALGHIAAAAAIRMCLGQGWRVPFGLLGMILAAGLACTLFAREDGALDASNSAPNQVDWRALLLASAVAFAAVAGSVHVGYWLPNLVAQHLPKGDPKALKEAVSFIVLWLQAGALAGVAVSGILAVRFGARGPLAGFLVAAIASVALMPALGSVEAIKWAAPLAGFATTGMTGLLAVAFPGLFARDQRAASLSLAYSSGRVVTAFQLAGMGGLMAALGPSAAFAWGSVIYVAAFPLVFLWPRARVEEQATGQVRRAA